MIRRAVLAAVVSSAASACNLSIPSEPIAPGSGAKPPVATVPVAGKDTNRSRTAVNTGPERIVVAFADGSGAQAVALGRAPAWSPAGDQIAFERDGSICVIRPDGTNERCVAYGFDPAWSPDATQLVFTDPTGIVIARADGSGQRLLVPNLFRTDTYRPWDMGVGQATWSPDGDRIAFAHLGDGDMMPGQIFVVAVSGGTPTRLTDTGSRWYAESFPAWSPDGRQVTFWSYGTGISVGAAVGGASRSAYWDFPTVAYWVRPRFMPDGQRIAYTIDRTGNAAPSIWTVSAAGGGIAMLLDNAADPSWSRDGARMAFVRRDNAP
jgi:Tol biopolymer transport system component